jgi:protein phosphatase
MPAPLHYTAKTDIGKRYDHNEDFYLLPEPSEKFGITSEAITAKGQLFILTAGMGGANAGEVASQLTAGWVAAAFYQGEPDEALPAIIANINARIFDLAAEHEQYQGMSTTIVAAHVWDDRLTVCSVGDSRAYFFSKGGLEQITEDQSEVWEIFKAGGITKQELRHHPRKHILRQAIGGHRQLAANDVNSYHRDMKPEEMILLCSDGLSDMVGDEEIQTILTDNGADLNAAADALIAAANRNGGRDNITVVLFEPGIS